MIYGIFIGHGNFPYSAVNAVFRIIGEQDNNYCLGDFQKDNTALYKEINKIITDNSADHYFIFVDFFGSSYSMPALKISNSKENVTHFFGYNIPIIIDFFMHRNKKSPNELFNKLIEIGKNSIRS